jgi:hypothetical protein
LEEGIQPSQKNFKNAGDRLKKDNLEIKPNFGKWQGFLLIPGVAEEKIKITFIFGRIDINAILWEVLKDRDLVFMNNYAGKKNFKER